MVPREPPMSWCPYNLRSAALWVYIGQGQFDPLAAPLTALDPPVAIRWQRPGRPRVFPRSYLEPIPEPPESPTTDRASHFTPRREGPPLPPAGQTANHPIRYPGPCPDWQGVDHQLVATGITCSTSNRLQPQSRSPSATIWAKV